MSYEIEEEFKDFIDGFKKFDDVGEFMDEKEYELFKNSLIVCKEGTRKLYETICFPLFAVVVDVNCVGTMRRNYWDEKKDNLFFSIEFHLDREATWVKMEGKEYISDFWCIDHPVPQKLIDAVQDFV